METHTDNSHFGAPIGTESISFVIDLSDPDTLQPATFGEQRRYSVVVRIEPEEVLFILSSTEPETVTRTFAEALAKRTALLAIEKDFPNGVDLSLTAKRVDHLPAEFEDRLPDFLMNRNKAWFVSPRAGSGTPEDVLVC
jgi:hypothetical protein